jgi:hypothetical protein
MRHVKMFVVGRISAVARHPSGHVFAGHYQIPVHALRPVDQALSTIAIWSALARRLHGDVRALVPGLDALPEPEPAEPRDPVLSGVTGLTRCAGGCERLAGLGTDAVEADVLDEASREASPALSQYSAV